MSSSSDDGGIGFPGMFSAASPMPGLPVAGKDSTIGDPYEYGKFQNFLPDIKAEGRNDSATGLRPEMFEYKKPSGVVDPQVQQLRDELASVKASAGGGGAAGGGGGGAAGGTNWGQLFQQMSPQDLMTWQATMNSAGRGEEANSALNAWRGSMSQPGGGGGQVQQRIQQPVYQDSFGGGATGAGSDGSY